MATYADLKRTGGRGGNVKHNSRLSESDSLELVLDFGWPEGPKLGPWKGGGPNSKILEHCPSGCRFPGTVCFPY